MNEETKTSGDNLLDFEMLRDASKERPMAVRRRRNEIFLLRTLQEPLRRYAKRRWCELSIVEPLCLLIECSGESSCCLMYGMEKMMDGDVWRELYEVTSGMIHLVTSTRTNENYGATKVIYN